MALSCKVGAFNTGTDAVNSTQDITCGFQPKAIIFWWSGIIDSSDACKFGDSKQGVGFATQTKRGCVTTTDDNGAGSQGSSTGHRVDACIASLTVNSTTWDGLIDIDAFANWPADGFRLIVDDVMPLDLRVGFIAYGGTDLTDVDLIQFQTAAATGNEDVTSLSFEPSVLFFLNGAPSMTSAGTQAVNTAGQISIGYARTATEQGCLVCGTDQGSASADTSQLVTHGSSCSRTKSLTAPGTSDSVRAFVAMLSNGFTLNTTTVTTTIPQTLALAIKGGAWKGANVNLQTNTSTTMPVSGLSATPRGVFVCSAHSAGATYWNFSVGAATSTTERHAQGTVSADGSGNMRVVRAVEHDECLVWSVMPGSDGADDAAGSIDALMDVNSVDADGFTFIMDDAVPATPATAWVVMVGETAAADTNEAAAYVPVITRNPLNVMY